VIDGKTGELVDNQSHLLHETGNLDKIHEDMGPHTWGIGIYTYKDIISGEKPVEEITDIYFQCYGLEYRRLTNFIFELYKKYANRIIPAEEVKRLCEIQIPNQLTRLNTQTFKLEDYYQFPQGYEIRSLQFTPRKTSNGKRPGTDGYITVLMINEDGDNFFRELWIFDAARLKEGPVCILTHPELNYAFTLHSVWTSDLESNPDDGYRVDMIEDYTNMINKIWLGKKKVKSFFEEKVFPHLEKNAKTNSLCE
jgi:hypothetical protein